MVLCLNNARGTTKINKNNTATYSVQTGMYEDTKGKHCGGVTVRIVQQKQSIALSLLYRLDDSYDSAALQLALPSFHTFRLAGICYILTLDNSVWYWRPSHLPKLPHRHCLLCFPRAWYRIKNKSEYHFGELVDVVRGWFRDPVLNCVRYRQCSFFAGVKAQTESSRTCIAEN